MASIKLELDDCIADSPQTRALIGVFEKDAEVLTKYAQGIQVAFQRIAYAQTELTAATQALSHHLREFDKQNFTLTTDNDYISSVLKELAEKVDQISSFNAVLQTQIAENTVYSSSRFVDKYLSNIEHLKAQFNTSDKIHIEAMKRLAKLSKKRTSESAWMEATNHLHAARKGHHVTSMNYCSLLNLLQARKKTGLLDPLIGFIEAQMGQYKMGSEICQVELEEYLNQLQDSLREIDKSTNETERDNSVIIDRIDAESTRRYIPDPPPSMEFPDLPIDLKSTQISGWFPNFFGRDVSPDSENILQPNSSTTILIGPSFSDLQSFAVKIKQEITTQTTGGNLMQQAREEVAGRLVMDLDGCTVGFADVDDRRYVFQIMSQDAKHSVVLQAESKHSCHQWVATVQNISKGLYLAHDPAKAAELMQAAAKPVEPELPSSNSEPPSTEPVSHEAGDSQSNQEESKPAGMFARFKNAASSLVAPLNKTEFKVSSKNDDGAVQDNDTSGLQAVIQSTTNYPISFDLPSSTTTQGNKKSSGEFTPGENSEEVSPKTNFHATYIVRFIGCRQVEEDIYNGYAVISECIRSIMAARALHNIFSMNEIELVVTDQGLKLIHTESKTEQGCFATSEIIMAANHRENTRLFGIIIRQRQNGTDVNLCYVFESNSDGAEVCCSIATAQVMMKSLAEQDELERQKELESDLEEQSKLMAVSPSTASEEAATFEEEDLTMRDDE